MAGQVGRSPTSTALLSCPNLMLLTQRAETFDEETVEKQDLLRQDVKHLDKKAILAKIKHFLCHHSLCRLQHISCDSPVCFMMFSEAAAAFIALHMDNTVCLYKAYGHKQTLLTYLPFKGLTVTKIPGCLVGWGPGHNLTLLDSNLHPLVTADNVLDIQICEAAEDSTELVTAGVGNVCVWSTMLMHCKVKIQEGLQQHRAFTHMALAPPRPGKPHRGFVASGQIVTVVDLDCGRVVEHKKDLCSCDITAMAYCFQLDCLIIASQELPITVWGPDWVLRASLVGHNDVVNSLLYCPELNMLASSSADCTIRMWNVEECKEVQCVHTEQKNPPLHIGSTGKGDTLFSFSHQGVDFWTVTNLYTLCCELRGNEGATLRQIVVSHLPPPYPTRVLCSSDNHVALVAAKTGEVLTSFKAKNRILCADYCIHKEILLVLTEAGTVLKANTLTNPITLMQEWRGKGQGPWEHEPRVAGNNGQNLSVPGPACCLVLYSCVADTQKALEEWESLQQERGCNRREYRAIDDAKNKFLIITGQSGGCVSVLKINNGDVLYRTPAHNGQRVTAVQAYPDKSCLLSTGEDLTLVVWRVYPHDTECLTQQLSLQCDQPPVHLVALGSQLALTCSSTHSLKFFSLFNQKQTDYQPKEGHSDHLTGLCAIPEMKVVVSSSLDKTLHIWNDKNQLIRTLHLQAVPQCVAYSGSEGELFLGIKGNLYRMKCAKYLPREYQQMLHNTHCVQPHPDAPIPVNKDTYNQTNTSRDETEKSQASTSKQFMLGGMREQEYLVTMNNDLEALLQGTVKCKKEKPSSTKQTRKEAFDRYMNIIYDLPPNDKIDLEDPFDLAKCSSHAKSIHVRPHKFPKSKEENSSQPKPEIPVKLEKKKQRKVLPTLMKVMPWPVERVTPLKKTVALETVSEVGKTEDIKPQETISPIDQPQPKPSTHELRTPAPLAQPEPSPNVPSFLQQFTEMEWFIDLFPDEKSIPPNLSPEDFCLKLLNHLQACRSTSKLKILTAIQNLHGQGLLLNTNKLYKGLVNILPKFARLHMSASDRAILTETLSLLMCLKSKISYDLMKKLLTLLAYQEVQLQKTVLRLLVEAGVDEAEQWLWPELENWDSELQDQSNTWDSLHGTADSWLHLWCSKFKNHNRCLAPRSTAKSNPPNFTAVDVLNYFCYVQEKEHRKATNVPAARQHRSILPVHDCSSNAIIRLMETNSMKRIRKPPGIILPPLIQRPFLMESPNYVTLPLPRVTLNPFHSHSDEDGFEEYPRRFFIQEQSLVEYYRR